MGGFELKSEEGTTQGDSVAMATYAIAIIPLILLLVELNSKRNTQTKSVAYADNLAAAGKFSDLKIWWQELCRLGPMFGYYPEASKSFLVTKSSKNTINEAKKHFKDTEIKISSSGKRYLGGVIGSEEFKEKFVEEKINKLCEELNLLSKIANYEPQAAYAAFTIAFKHKVNHIMRSIPNISKQLQRLDEVVNSKFIRNILGGSPFSDLMRDLFALPPRFGGLGIPSFTKISDDEFENSTFVSSTLRDSIINQNVQLNDSNATKKKQSIKNKKRQLYQEELQRIRKLMDENERKLNDFASMEYSLLWLTTIPIKHEGYCLTKQQFWDAINIRYGFLLKRLPIDCECGAQFDVNHALSCKKGGFISLRHNILRNTTCTLFDSVCKDVKCEPLLQEITGEELTPTSNNAKEARIDVAARGFWQTGQMAFFDIRVFNPLAKRCGAMNIDKTFELNEKEMKRSYNKRVIQIEHGSFTPLVVSALGGIGREADKFYKPLSEIVAEKSGSNYNVIVTWVRRKLIFSLLKSLVMCIRGSRSCYNSDEVSITNHDATTSEQICAIVGV